MSSITSGPNFFTSTSFAVGGYMLCSACLLISNKVAVHLLEAPSFIIFSQLIGTVLVVKAAKMLGYIQCDALEKKKAMAFLPVALIFVMTIFLNMKSLQYANVETFMIFRFSTPICIAVADYSFLGRQLPSSQSWISLFVLLLGSVGYGLSDSFFEVEGYAFCAIWYVMFCLDQIYLKHITNTVKMESNWGRVYYCNLLAALPLFVPFFLNSSEIVAVQNMSFNGFLALMISVLLGAAMSYFAWMARSLLAATSFTIVGNVCKILTIAINVMIWDKHASITGVGFLLACLGAAYFYKQAPMRDTKQEEENTEGGGSSSNIKEEKPILPK